MQSRNQYLKVLRGRYLKAKAKKKKTQILDEYCRNTGQVLIRLFIVALLFWGSISIP